MPVEIKHNQDPFAFGAGTQTPVSIEREIEAAYPDLARARANSEIVFNFDWQRGREAQEQEGNLPFAPYSILLTEINADPETISANPQAFLDKLRENEDYIRLIRPHLEVASELIYNYGVDRRNVQIGLMFAETDVGLIATAATFRTDSEARVFFHDSQTDKNPSIALTHFVDVGLLRNGGYTSFVISRDGEFLGDVDYEGTGDFTTVRPEDGAEITKEGLFAVLVDSNGDLAETSQGVPPTPTPQLLGEILLTAHEQGPQTGGVENPPAEDAEVGMRATIDTSRAFGGIGEVTLNRTPNPASQDVGVIYNGSNVTALGVSVDRSQVLVVHPNGARGWVSAKVVRYGDDYERAFDLPVYDQDGNLVDVGEFIQGKETSGITSYVWNPERRTWDMTISSEDGLNSVNLEVDRLLVDGEPGETSFYQESDRSTRTNIRGVFAGVVDEKVINGEIVHILQLDNPNLRQTYYFFIADRGLVNISTSISGHHFNNLSIADYTTVLAHLNVGQEVVAMRYDQVDFTQWPDRPDLPEGTRVSRALIMDSLDAENSEEFSFRGQPIFPLGVLVTSR